MIPEAEVETVEVQAIMALCHHAVCDPACERCRFRAAAGIEHIIKSIHEALANLGGNS